MNTTETSNITAVVTIPATDIDIKFLLDIVSERLSESVLMKQKDDVFFSRNTSTHIPFGGGSTSNCSFMFAIPSSCTNDLHLEYLEVSLYFEPPFIWKGRYRNDDIAPMRQTVNDEFESLSLS